MSKFTLDKVYKIWDDENGDCITIRPDSDGLGLVEISASDNTGNTCGTIFINPLEQLDMVIGALKLISKDFEEKSED